MRTRLTIYLVLLLMSAAMPTTVDGYGVDTHAAISGLAYTVARPGLQDNFFDALGLLETQPLVVELSSRTAQQWLIEGSRREDDVVGVLGYLDTALLLTVTG